MQKLRAFIDRNIQKVVTVQISLIIAVWAASAIIQPLQDWVLKNGVYELIIIVLISDILLRLADIKETDKTSDVNVFKDEPTAYPTLHQYLESKHPQKVDMIEYSTATVHDLLENLKRCRSELRILICNPDAAVTEFQRDRINDRIRDLTTVTFRDYSAVEVRMYTLPASIRGRLFDEEYLTVGWHTHTSEPAGLYGHTNPMINAYTNTSEGRMIKDMFTWAFEHLWSAPTTTTLISPGGRLHLSSVKDEQTSIAIEQELADDSTQI
jgi:hypothetical protein